MLISQVVTLKVSSMKLFQQNALERTLSLRFLSSLAVVIWLITLIMEYRTPVNVTPDSNPEETALIPLDDPIPITVQRPEKPINKPTREKTDKPKPSDLDKWVEKTKIPITDFKVTDQGNWDEPIEPIAETADEKDEPLMIPMLEKIAVPGSCKTIVDRNRQLHCLNRWIAEYIKSNVQYPRIPKKMGIEERVYISFVIDKQGQVTQVEIARGENEHLRQEARHLIENMPQFVPASQNGRKAAMKMMATVNFKLQ